MTKLMSNLEEEFLIFNLFMGEDLDSTSVKSMIKAKMTGYLWMEFQGSGQLLFMEFGNLPL